MLIALSSSRGSLYGQLFSNSTQGALEADVFAVWILETGETFMCEERLQRAQTRPNHGSSNSGSPKQEHTSTLPVALWLAKKTNVRHRRYTGGKDGNCSLAGGHQREAQVRVSPLTSCWSRSTRKARARRKSVAETPPRPPASCEKSSRDSSTLSTFKTATN